MLNGSNICIKSEFPLAAALSFVRFHKGIEAVLVGVVSQIELSQVLDAWMNTETSDQVPSSSWAWRMYTILTHDAGLQDE